MDADAVLAEVAQIFDLPDSSLTSDSRTRHIVDLVRMMERGGSGPGDPVRAVTSKVGDKWSTLIVMLLRDNCYRFNTFRRLVGLAAGHEISHKMLSAKLRILTRDGFVQRTVEPSPAPHVSYSLTDLGRELLGQINQLVLWVIGVETRIRDAREVFDQQAQLHGWSTERASPREADQLSRRRRTQIE